MYGFVVFSRLLIEKFSNEKVFRKNDKAIHKRVTWK